MDKWNSYNEMNCLDNVQTFNSSVQRFEPTQKMQSQTVNTGLQDIGVFPTQTVVEHHYYYHEYIYVPIKQKEVHYYNNYRF